MTTNIGVARNWTDLKTYSKSGNGNMSQSGPVLYSYSTPIGHAVEVKGKGWAYLITSETYSVTTEGKHKNAAHKATRYKAFTVPFLLLPPSAMTGRSAANRIASGRSIEEQHQGNLEHYDAAIREELDRISRARTHKSETYLEHLRAERARYCAVFNLRGVEVAA